ncbi:BTAD domain-containing putative transcriptional regulator [Streptomyces sp. MAR4 CNX-425]|uniref:BTAD domain-containing putative transcriptional regulator n=1 Tax=Streptomyces sp. MAR4 CNX-425 TaxID=3406343 RepID=UPI003B513990
MPTGRLLTALWGDDPPPTARKVLQNAVAGLRRSLRSPDTSISLDTQASGYLLRIPEDHIDWYRHQALVEHGRAEVESGAGESGARRLREAMRLWRGPVLADLVEAGIEWPELASIQRTRLDVLEDCVEAELAAGRHYEIVGELAAEVQAEPTRERLCGQLMLALYRSGRHAEALTVYRRARDTLVEELGLDPGRELRRLEQAILNHEETLLLPLTDMAQNERPADGHAQAGPPAGAGPTPPGTAERKLVSVLMIRTHLDLRTDLKDLECVSEALQAANAAIRQEVQRFGGVIHGVIGSLWIAIFGAPGSREDDAERATQAALAVQERMAAGIPLGPTVSRLSAATAVTTGEAMMTHLPNDHSPRTELLGGVFDRCAQLLTFVSPGTTRVCDVTLEASRHSFAYSPALDQLGGWLVTGDLVGAGHQQQAEAPFVGREKELDMLQSLLDTEQHRHRPCLVTVLGEPGMGKSRLMAEFARLVGERPDGPRLVIGCTRSFARVGEPGPLGGLVRSYAGITHADSPAAARKKLDLAVRGLVDSERVAEWLLTHLTPLALPEEGVAAVLSPSRSFPAWRFLEEIANKAPLVVVLEDLQWADDSLLDFVEEVVSSGTVPVLVVATARPELQARRPNWGPGRLSSHVLTVDPLPEADAAELFDAQLGLPSQGDRPGGHTRTADVLTTELLTAIGGHPQFAVEYARILREGISLWWERSAPGLSSYRTGRPGGGETELPVPQRVYNLVAARLDALAEQDKKVLQDVAMFDAGVVAAAVAAVGELPLDEVRRRLAKLERVGLLGETHCQGTEGEPVYAFRNSVICGITHSQIPRAIRDAKRQRVAAWLRRNEKDRPEFYTEKEEFTAPVPGEYRVPPDGDAWNLTSTHR